MLFVSEKEINCSKSSVLNKFCGAKSLKDFVNMKLPIKQISNQLNQHIDIGYFSNMELNADEY